MPSAIVADQLTGHRQRLRQRFLETGTKGFQDYELLELMLTYVIPQRDLKPLAKELIVRFGSLKKVLDASYVELTGVKGIGSKAATMLVSLRSLMERYFEEKAKESELLNSPEAVVAYCRASLEGEKNEVFQVLYLSARNRLIKSERLSEGTIDQAAVYPRRVLEGAFAAKAVNLIFVHNHPSGDPSPSEEDKRLTQTLAQAAALVGISVHDHIIVGNGRHFSFRESGLLK
ncbi:MAG: DNA repair protein RadC [Elusimicrobia bacterium]|nr:DNA repair protein RadC [Elusimicrobiota bacterium]